MKVISPLRFPTNRKYLLSNFAPSIFGFNLFKTCCIDLLRISKHFFKLWIIIQELLKLNLRYFT
jgi:hypothetical protein